MIYFVKNFELNHTQEIVTEEIVNEEAKSECVRVPVIQKLIVATIGLSNDRMVPQCNTYVDYHQVDSPDISSSDEIIVV